MDEVDEKAYYSIEFAHEVALIEHAWFMMTSVEVAHEEAIAEESDRYEEARDLYLDKIASEPRECFCGDGNRHYH